MEIFWLTIQDALDLIKATQMRDLLIPFFGACWLGVLITPLKGVDRRDHVAFITYALFMCAAAVTMLSVVPMVLMKMSFPPTRDALVILVCVPLTGLRWYWKREKKIVKEYVDGKTEKTAA